MKAVKVILVRVWGSKGWRSIVESSMQAALALVDGLTTSFEAIVNGSSVYATDTVTGDQLTDSTIRKPLRDYRYLQSKRVATSAPATTPKQLLLAIAG